MLRYQKASFATTGTSKSTLMSLPPDNFYLWSHYWSSGCFITPLYKALENRKKLLMSVFKEQRTLNLKVFFKIWPSPRDLNSEPYLAGDLWGSDITRNMTLKHLLKIRLPNWWEVQSNPMVGPKSATENI